MRRIFFHALLLLFPFIASAQADFKGETATLRLVADSQAVKPGLAFRAGVVIKLIPDWHIYWKNPGDAGIPTRLEWTLPDGVKTGGINWPVPQIHREDQLVTYGYSDQVLLSESITLPETIKAGDTVTLKVKASWLACKDVCIPESAELAIELPVTAEQAASSEVQLFDKVSPLLPKRVDIPLSYAAHKNSLEIALPEEWNAKAGNTIDFYPADDGFISNVGERRVVQKEVGSVLVIPASANTNGKDAAFHAVIQIGTVAYEVQLQPSDYVPQPLPSLAESPALPLLLLFAFLGGVILNVMPCVFPVLSLKALSLAQHAHVSRRQSAAHGLAYTLGILLCFLGIAALLLALRHAGAQLGWGFQMQSPVFVSLMALMLFALGLNLLGGFEFPHVIGGRSKASGLVESFLTGLLITLVATPCTAPFMASAVGAALAQSPTTALLIFLFLGLGLAMPFLLLALFPTWLRHMPKPGRWMETAKQALAFPLFASAIWLVWVLAQQGGASAVLLSLSSLLVFALACWWQGKRGGWNGLSMIIAILAFIIAAQATLAAPSSLREPAFSEEKITSAQAQGTPVFVNATAAWCITCQVNKKMALDTDEVKNYFTKHGIIYMEADWTRQDAGITAYLRRFGYSGVPLYVFYPAKGEPIILPQVLTPAIVLEALEKAGASRK